MTRYRRRAAANTVEVEHRDLDAKLLGCWVRLSRHQSGLDETAATLADLAVEFKEAARRRR